MQFNSVSLTKPFVCGLKQEIHGINQKLEYPRSGKSFELPRFISVEMQQAQMMNRIAKNREYQLYSNMIPSKATGEDLKRLTSESMEESYNRAIWINPKTLKPYYLLGEGEDKNGNVHLRILDKDGQFVKNAKVKQKEVILTDLLEGMNHITQIADVDFVHTDFIDILANRYNPFAKYKIIQIKSDNDIVDLKKELSSDTSFISASYGVFHEKPEGIKGGKNIQNVMLKNIKEIQPKELELLEDLKGLSKNVRVLAGAGNRGENEVAGLLLNTGFEGVGGLNIAGNVDINSASRNSLFTQHYEPFTFPITKTKDGINISGLKGTDIELDADIPDGTFLGTIKGTSFSTPVRAAKLSLNEMMQGIL